MNWVELKLVLAVACGLGMFACLVCLLAWSMMSGEDLPAAKSAGRIAIAVIVVEIVLFLALLVCASQVPR